MPEVVASRHPEQLPELLALGLERHDPASISICPKPRGVLPSVGANIQNDVDIEVVQELLPSDIRIPTDGAPRHVDAGPPTDRERDPLETRS
jgi:hypothetical protein